MKESKRKILLAAAAVGFASLVTVIIAFFVMMATYRVEVESFYPKQRDIKNYDLVLESSYFSLTTYHFLVTGANQNLLFAEWDGYSYIFLNAFDPEYCIINDDAQEIVLDYDKFIELNVDTEYYDTRNVIVLDSNFLDDYALTFTLKGHNFVVNDYDDYWLLCSCIDFGDRVFQVDLSELGIENITCRGYKYNLSICEELFYNINGNLPTITQDEVLDTACEWSGYDFYYNSTSLGEIVGMNDNLVFVNNYDASTGRYKTLIVSGMLRSTSYYDVDDAHSRVSITLTGLVQGCFINSAQDVLDAEMSFYVGKDKFVVTTCNTTHNPNYWTVNNESTNRTYTLYANANMVTDLLCSIHGGEMISIEIDKDVFVGYNGVILSSSGASSPAGGVDILSVITFICYLAAMPLIIIVMCMTKSKKRAPKGNMLTLSIITPILLIAMLVGLLCIPGTRIFGIAFAVPLLVSAALFITGACVGNVFLKKPKPIIRSPAVMREYALDDEIKALCKYYKDGLLTKEQLKNTIIKKIRAEYDN